MFISDTVFYAGVNDRKVDLFEGQYPVPNGISYNSYIIKGEKVAVMDSVDKNFGEEWLENIEKVLGGKAPDYLVVLHMEPDHSANIKAFLLFSTFFPIIILRFYVNVKIFGQFSLN